MAGVPGGAAGLLVALLLGVGGLLVLKHNDHMSHGLGPALFTVTACLTAMTDCMIDTTAVTACMTAVTAFVTAMTACMTATTACRTAVTAHSSLTAVLPAWWLECECLSSLQPPALAPP